jgi:hypothetical protein
MASYLGPRPSDTELTETIRYHFLIEVQHVTLRTHLRYVSENLDLLKRVEIMAINENYHGPNRPTRNQNHHPNRQGQNQKLKGEIKDKFARETLSTNVQVVGVIPHGIDDVIPAAGNEATRYQGIQGSRI